MKHVPAKKAILISSSDAHLLWRSVHRDFSDRISRKFRLHPQTKLMMLSKQSFAIDRKAITEVSLASLQLSANISHNVANSIDESVVIGF